MSTTKYWADDSLGDHHSLQSVMIALGTVTVYNQWSVIVNTELIVSLSCIANIMWPQWDIDTSSCSFIANDFIPTTSKKSDAQLNWYQRNKHPKVKILWHSKLPSNHSATVTTLLYSIISIYDLIVSLVKKKINNLFKEAIDQYIQDTRQVFQVWHNLCPELTSMWTFKMYSRNTKTTNEPTQVITNQTNHRWTFRRIERPWNI